MTEEKFEDFLKRALDDLEPVPVPPREAMWAQIDEARRFQRRAERTTPRRVFLNWSVGLAAMLAVGIGIGRMTARQQLAPVTNPQVASVGNRPNSTTYQVAVAQHLSKADALLTSFRTQPDKATPDPQLATFARELLTSTQLLMDSPAGDDPMVAALLNDLELILVQIAHTATASPDERAIIEDGIDKTAVLPRLRAKAGGPVQAGT
jgi:hypothetical protein